MANSLLDFVMSLVRDPDVAARYAADPAGALADAHLDGVTSADVSNLIPMVSDSLASTTAPGHVSGVDALLTNGADNVWASGAATSAFDAFGDVGAPAGGPVHAVHTVTAGAVDQAASVITDPGLAADSSSPTGAGLISDVHDWGGVPGQTVDQLVSQAGDLPGEHHLDPVVDHAVDIGGDHAVDSGGDLHGHPVDDGFDLF